MINIDVKISGDLTAALDRYEKRIKQQALLAGVAKAAEIVYEEMRINAAKGGATFPDVQTGTLEKNIYRAYVPEASTDDRKVYVVGPRKGSAPHWVFLEFGTSRMSAQPFIRPSASRIPAALEQGKQRMAERLREG